MDLSADLRAKEKKYDFHFHAGQDNPHTAQTTQDFLDEMLGDKGIRPGEWLPKSLDLHADGFFNGLVR